MTVAIPVEENPLFTEVTETVPSGAKFDAVVAVPVRFPIKVVAVTTPETIISEGSLEVLNVPDVMLSALMAVIPAPDPTKDDAVITPARAILDGKNEVLKVPDVILEALSRDISDPNPEKDVAVIIPAL